MRLHYAAACGLFLAPAIAVAQPAGTANPPPAQHQAQPAAAQAGAHNQAHQAVRQRIEQDLEKAGYKNVRVMPESFLVRANDAQNRPVMMIVNPDSITAVTEVGGQGQQGSGGAQHGSAPVQAQNQAGNAGTHQQNR